MRASLAFHVIFLLGSGDSWCLVRIEADGDHVELLAHIKLHKAHPAGESGEHLAAQHGAVVVDEVQDYWLLTEVVAQSDSLARLITERQVGRNLAVEMLFDADVLKGRRPNVCRRGHNAFVHALSPGGN